ncbi:replication initiation protein [Desulfopila sp. IMCC35006]|nr:replication initiation protein [Desulfopila sp. IMCC35006]
MVLTLCLYLSIFKGIYSLSSRRCLLTKNDKSPLIVQSNKLVESRYTLSVGEQRLVFAVASMIHPDDVDFYPYEIKIRDLASILNIDLNNAYRDADKITDQLMQRVIVIPEDDGPLKVGWVSSCKYNNKKGSISFRFDPSLKPYLLQLRRDFTQSKLTILAQFQSIYSIRIYQLLKQYRKIGHREFRVDDLKEILGIDKGKYAQFKQFRAWVLNQAKKEFEKKDDAGFYQCDLSFILETIREGRKITRVKFIIVNQAYQETLPFMDKKSVFPVRPELSSEKELLEKLEYFGIPPLRAQSYINDLGEDKTQQILDYYNVRLAAGKVDKKGGAFLAYLLREKITGKSAFEAEEERQKKEKKTSEWNKKFEIEEAAKKRLSDIELKFLQKDEIYKNEIIQKFESSLHPVLLKSFRENGVNSIQFREQFLEFAEEYL